MNTHVLQFYRVQNARGVTHRGCSMAKTVRKKSICTPYKTGMKANEMNAHVLQWYRWQHFMAHRQHRFFAMLHWATQHNTEAGGHDKRFTTDY
jgi:hypothetical protein